MGSLIQTKGTQRLARLFNNRFDKGSIGQTRQVKNSSGTLLQTAFATLPTLLNISDTFIAQYSSAYWVLNGRDVLYPAATLVAVQVAGKDIIFNDPVGTWPDLIAVGNSAADLTHSAGVPKDAKVKKVDRGNPTAGQTTVSFDVAVTAQNGDCISFCPPKHQNLVKRWRYYLGTELHSPNQTLIQKAILTALTDPSVTLVKFQAIESTTQSALIETILGTTDDDDDNLDPTKKSLFIALLTAQTNAPDPVDAQ
jgi:hypothetical protein